MSYTKPVLLQNDDLAEGVYAASGDGQPSIQVVFDSNFGSTEWYKQTIFKILLSGDLGVQIELTLEFDKSTDWFIEGADPKVGNTVIISYPKDVYWLKVVGDHNIKCTKAAVRTILQTWNQT